MHDPHTGSDDRRQRFEDTGDGLFFDLIVDMVERLGQEHLSVGSDHGELQARRPGVHHQDLPVAVRLAELSRNGRHSRRSSP